jgi:hypothetical protein
VTNDSASFEVGPVFARIKPSFFLSLESPVGQAGPVYVSVGLVLG